MRKLIILLKEPYNNKIAKILAEVGINYIYAGIIIMIIGTIITITLWKYLFIMPIAIAFLIFIYTYLKAVKYLKEAKQSELQQSIYENTLGIYAKLKNIDENLVTKK